VEDYPSLSAHFAGVRITHHPGIKVCRHGSSLDTRQTAIDRKEISSIIKNKSAKMSDYQAELPGRPLWLLFYSEGWPPTGRLHSAFSNEEVVHLIRSAVEEAGSAFDRIWWGRNLLAGEPEVVEVV
jgi:hypothetical protein